ncbi:uncharacterized protein PG986_009629 [Apiospora aurea]|uniref:Uncharacterized protein n=1 Tax=Apiospora aurea TaxID=335848 RepID=A0ABR1Q8B9_9PEZI
MFPPPLVVGNTEVPAASQLPVLAYAQYTPQPQGLAVCIKDATILLLTLAAIVTIVEFFLRGRKASSQPTRVSQKYQDIDPPSRLDPREKAYIHGMARALLEAPKPRQWDDRPEDDDDGTSGVERIRTRRHGNGRRWGKLGI